MRSLPQKHRCLRSISSVLNQRMLAVLGQDQGPLPHSHHKTWSAGLIEKGSTQMMTNVKFYFFSVVPRKMFKDFKLCRIY